MAAEAAGDQTQVHLLKHATPIYVYRLPDTMMVEQFLHILTLMYVTANDSTPHCLCESHMRAVALTKCIVSLISRSRISSVAKTPSTCRTAERLRRF
jgi:hypothetical protein